MGKQMTTTRLRACKPGQVVLWSSGFSFRWLLIELVKESIGRRVECKTLAMPAFVYDPDSIYSIGKTTTWHDDTKVILLSEMEVLAWASK